MKNLKSTKVINTVNEILYSQMKDQNVSFQIFDCSLAGNITITIEPIRYKGNDLDGMQIIYENGIFEVSEFQAGKNNNELHIYLETKYFKIALKNMMQGNKKRKAIKILN